PLPYGREHLFERDVLSELASDGLAGKRVVDVEVPPGVDVDDFEAAFNRPVALGRLAQDLLDVGEQLLGDPNQRRTAVANAHGQLIATQIRKSLGLLKGLVGEVFGAFRLSLQ